MPERSILSIAALALALAAGCAKKPDDEAFSRRCFPTSRSRTRI